MHFDYYEIDKMPVAVIDNFFSENEYNDILQECQFLSSGNCRKLEDPKDTGSAPLADENLNPILDENGNLQFLKNNKALFLDDIYPNRNISDILTHTAKIFDGDLLLDLFKHNDLFYQIITSTRDTTLLSYYENLGSYGSHRDQSAFTILSWVYKTPKKFKGGDLILGKNKEKIIECKPNRVVYFSSPLLHEVNKITMDQSDMNKGNGRFTISKFASWR